MGECQSNCCKLCTRNSLQELNSRLVVLTFQHYRQAHHKNHDFLSEVFPVRIYLVGGTEELRSLQTPNEAFAKLQGVRSAGIKMLSESENVGKRGF